MNYKQKYNEILAWARKYKAKLNGMAIEEVLPELAESEDERIRKSIIQTLVFACAHKLVDYDTVVKMKAYLEKQKESFVSMNPAPGFDSGGISVYHESEEEEIRKEIIEYLKLHDKGEDDYAHTMFSKWFAYLEKQKEQTSSIPWVKSDNVTNPDKPYIDKAGWFYTTDGRMCPASEIEKQKEEEGYEAIPVESTLEYKLGFKAGKESEKRKGQDPVEESIRTKIISRAKSEKQVVLISETNDNAEIGWDTRSLEDTKNLLEYGLAFINKQLEQKPVKEQKEEDTDMAYKSLADTVITELDKYRGDNFWKAPWVIDSTGLSYPLHFAKIGARWQKEQKSTVPKPHKGNDGNPYDMNVSDAQEYAIKRGFGVPFNDGEVYVDERHLTQTIGNILRWADEHPKEPHYTKRNALFDKCVENCDPEVMKKVSDEVDEMLEKEQRSTDVTDIIYNAISEVCHTGNPKDFAEMNQTVFKVAQRVAEMCQKREWSEKDEVAMRITIDWLIEYRDRHANLEETKDEINYCIDWLKSLCPQPQGVYKTAIECILKMCESYEKKGIFTDERARDFLSNVRVKCKDAIDCAPILDEPSWKPNKEQMEALESAVKLYKDTHFEIHHEKIVSLYEQLKKL